MTFSRQLLRSLFLLLGLLVLVLVAVVVSQRAVLQNAALVARDVFVPAVRVERLTAIAQALSAPVAAGPLAADASFEKICSPRQIHVLAERLLESLGEGSVSDARQRLGAGFAAAQAVAPRGCRSFLAEADQILRSPQRLLSQPPAALAPRMAQALTERVSWVSVPPCLYLQEGGRRFYLRGPQGYCLEADDSGRLGLGSELALGSSARQLGNLVYARLLAPQSAAGTVSDARRFAFTLHRGIAQQLEQYADCWLVNKPCPLDMPIPLTRTEGATAAVLDAQTGAVLGLQCFGPVCSLGRLAEAQPLAAALLEAPPASVAKLFFSLALAESPSPPKDLLFQIKTSGQLDRTVVKRNEWWERTAVCDLQARPLGTAPHPCPIPARATVLADRLGWNAGCPLPAKDCGRVALTPGMSGLSGYMGVIQPVAAGSAPTARPAADRLYLGWNDYDRIRAAGGVTQIAQPYREASAAVQAVLGAAEARTSALGLAGLSSGLYRMSHGQAPEGPSLVRPLGRRTSTGESGGSDAHQVAGQPQHEARRLEGPARLVRQGMSKVLTPAEPGWRGDGTAHRAFRTSFGRPCPSGCPVEGKTGTVSGRDPRFAGTTTFSGLVDLPGLLSLMGAPTSLPPDLPPVLAIGVIVFNPDRSRPPGGHAASHLAMRLVRDLLSPALPVPGGSR